MSSVVVNEDVADDNRLKFCEIILVAQSLKTGTFICEPGASSRNNAMHCLKFAPNVQDTPRPNSLGKFKKPIKCFASDTGKLYRW